MPLKSYYFDIYLTNHKNNPYPRFRVYFLLSIFTYLSLNELSTTQTEEKLIAADAIIRDIDIPANTSAPAAIGIQIEL